jgi:hypothetical protein
MSFKGYVDKGWIRPAEPINLPDGTPVTFTRAKSSSRRGQPSFRNWKSKSLRTLMKEQGVGPLKSLKQLAGDWPAHESLDEFLAFIRKGRR